MSQDADHPAHGGTFWKAMSRTELTSFPVGALYTVVHMIRSLGRTCTDALLAEARGGGSSVSTSNQLIKQEKHNRVMTWDQPFGFELLEAPILPFSRKVAKALTVGDAKIGLIPTVQVEQVDLLDAISIAGLHLKTASDIDDASLPLGDRCAPFLIANRVCLAIREIATGRQLEIEKGKDAKPGRIAALTAVIDRAGGEARLLDEAKVLSEKAASLRPKVEALLLEKPEDFGHDEGLAQRLSDGWFIFTTKLRMQFLTDNPATVDRGDADAAFGRAGPLLQDACQVFDLIKDDDTGRHLLAIAERQSSSRMACDILCRFIRIKGSEKLWFKGRIDWQGQDWSLLEHKIFADALHRAWKDPGTRPKLAKLLTPSYVAKMTEGVGAERVLKHPALEKAYRASM